MIRLRAKTDPCPEGSGSGPGPVQVISDGVIAKNAADGLVAGGGIGLNLGDQAALFILDHRGDAGRENRSREGRILNAGDRKAAPIRFENLAHGGLRQIRQDPDELRDRRPLGNG